MSTDDAAIGSERAASLYGAAILERDLEGDRQNYTRFLVIAPEPTPPPQEGAKTSLVFQVRHEPGRWTPLSASSNGTAWT